MCGILGFTTRNKHVSKNRLLPASEKLKSRGPDYYGEYYSKVLNLGLAHRRLAIIDLSDSGNQPFFSVCKNFVVIFNGEIYNYVELKKILTAKGYTFRTESDTEVLLASYMEWGELCVHKFDGMFSFCIYNEKQHTMFLARDRSGEKPFYYHINSEGFYFASTLPALITLMPDKPKIDIMAVAELLSKGYIPNEKSIYCAVRKLQPGTAIIFDCHNYELKSFTYWKIPQYESHQSTDVELKEEFDQILTRSIRRQFQADCPLAILLSGGLDSSLITAMASKSFSEINTFSVTFPDYSVHDESKFSNIIAREYSTNHTVIPLGEPTPEFFLRLVSTLNEPFFDSSFIPTFLLCEQVAKTFKVALGGDGADEIFGGYNRYSRLYLYERLKSIPFIKYTKSTMGFLHDQLSEGFPLKNFFYTFCQYIDYSVHDHPHLFGNKTILTLLRDKGFKELPGREFPIFNKTQNHFVDSMTRYEFCNYLPLDILSKIDTASMAHSLELRSPFLSLDCLNFAFGKLKPSMKVNKRYKKIFLTEFSKRYLPQQFNYVRKKGFSFPLETILRKKPYQQLLMDTFSSLDSFFPKNCTRKIVSAMNRGLPVSEKVYSLLMLELWIKNQDYMTSN